MIRAVGQYGVVESEYVQLDNQETMKLERGTHVLIMLHDTLGPLDGEVVWHFGYPYAQLRDPRDPMGKLRFNCRLVGDGIPRTRVWVLEEIVV